jgi:cytochrome P450
MWPPISGIRPRISDNDAVISGVSIPEETNVAWSARACLRIKDVFSANVEVYNPDRWRLTAAEQVQLMASTVDLCLGQDRWGCLGKPIILVELNKLMV